MNARTPTTRADRAHPSTPPPPRPLDDDALVELVLALGPIAEVDSVAGLRARYRDPREHPATGGEQRDAALALDLAHDRGHLEAHRRAHARFMRLPLDVRATALWIAQRRGAVREGVPVRLDAWVDTYGTLEGPRALAEAFERATAEVQRAVALTRSLRHTFRVRPTPDHAAAIDAAGAAEAQARTLREIAATELRAWSRARFEALWSAWRSL